MQGTTDGSFLRLPCAVLAASVPGLCCQHSHFLLFQNIYLLIYLFGSTGSLLQYLGPSIAEHRPNTCCTRAQESQLKGSVAWRHVGSEFSDQGSNLCPPHWKADSSPLSHQGSSPTLKVEARGAETENFPGPQSC